MWIGTTHGYSWAETLPIFFGVFAAPTIFAGLIWWNLS